MDGFDLQKWISEHPHLFSSTEHEDLGRSFSMGTGPSSLEDVGIPPGKVLGEGSYKNYIYERNLSGMRSIGGSPSNPCFPSFSTGH